MKHFLAALLIILFLLPASGLAKDGVIHIETVFDSEAVTASGTATSRAIELSRVGVAGYFSLQVTATGDGTATIEYQLSNDGVTFVEPTGAADVVSGLVKTSGPGSDGKNIYSLSPMLARFIRFKITETGTSDTITITAVLAYQ